jgi:PTH1 family peptidyl-tRNA hydrolase
VLLGQRRGESGSSGRGTPVDAVVLGLGNPGPRFEGTRHNVGADALRVIARRSGARLATERAAVAECARAKLGGRTVILGVPLTYMNDSGLAARALWKRGHQEDLSRLVVVHDELDLPPGLVRVKVGGGLAGHKGLISIRDHLGGAGFVRVRIGIGKPTGRAQGADWVLARPGKADREALEVAVEVAADAVEAVVAEGPERAMCAFNGRELPPR